MKKKALVVLHKQLQQLDRATGKLSHIEPVDEIMSEMHRNYIPALKLSVWEYPGTRRLTDRGIFQELYPEFSNLPYDIVLAYENEMDSLNELLEYYKYSVVTYLTH